MENITLYRIQGTQTLLRTLRIENVLKEFVKPNIAQQIQQLRADLKRALPQQRCKKAQQLPILVCAATFKKLQESYQMNQYNGLVMLEVNKLASETEAHTIRREAAAMPQTLLAFVGSSGLSVKIIIRFSLPDGTLPQTQTEIEAFHSHAYQHAVKAYQPQISSMIFLKEPLLTRGCRISHDPGIYFNPEAIPIRIAQPLTKVVDDTWRVVADAPINSLERLFPSGNYYHRIAMRFDAALMQTLKEVKKLTDENLKRFFTTLAQQCLNFEIPESEAIAFTLQYERLRAHKTLIHQDFRACYMLNQVSEGKSLLSYAQTLGYCLDEFMKRRYFFRCNEMTNAIEYIDRSTFHFAFSPVTPKIENSICMEAQLEGLQVWTKDITRYLHSDLISGYHPVDTYFASLPAWDGNDHIRTLASRVSKSDTVWQTRFYRWFLSMVAHWMELDLSHGNSATPLLVGTQGCGKSTFCLHLLPPELRIYYTDSVDFSKRKETELALHQYLLINIDEFDSIKPSQQALLKQILQKSSINMRLPYRSNTENLRRYATFIATSNNFDLLTDPTGSRRFLCVEVEGRIDYTTTIPYEQLYAQAKAALEQGERYWFTAEEEEEITFDNRLFQQISLEEELFFHYFTPAKEIHHGESLLAIEILDYIASQRKGFVINKSTSRIFGKVLTKHKVPFRRLSNGTYYSVLKNK